MLLASLTISMLQNLKLERNGQIFFYFSYLLHVSSRLLLTVVSRVQTSSSQLCLPRHSSLL